jgi:uncharacterized protein (DUF433 family)
MLQNKRISKIPEPMSGRPVRFFIVGTRVGGGSRLTR